MRVGIIALLHESNTFISEPTTLREFEQDMLLTGEAIRERMAGMKHEVGGFFAALDEAGVTAVPIFAARALPYGTISADAWNALMSALDAALDHTENLDGILVAPHGATVSEEHRDADGSWLRHLRFRVGYDLPIIGTIDPHTNLSPLMVDSTDVLTAYRTNPHIDQLERGQEAARLMIRTLKKEIVPTQAAVYPPMAINIEAQNTSEQPCVALYQLAEEIRQRPGVLSASIVLGFPYADVTEMGSSVIVVTDNQPKLAQQYAAELGEAMWNRREEFAGKMISVHDALDKCAQLPSPVCLLDMGDNVGGGSPADGTILLHALHEKLMGPTVVCLADPAAVKQAEAAGAGNRVEREDLRDRAAHDGSQDRQPPRRTVHRRSHGRLVQRRQILRLPHTARRFHQLRPGAYRRRANRHRHHDRPHNPPHGPLQPAPTHQLRSRPSGVPLPGRQGSPSPPRRVSRSLPKHRPHQHPGGNDSGCGDAALRTPEEAVVPVGGGCGMGAVSGS